MIRNIHHDNIVIYNHQIDYKSFRDFGNLVWPKNDYMVDSNRIEWQYIKNPLRLSGAPSTLYIYKENNEILGTLGTIPFNLTIHDKVIRANWLTDYFVSPLMRQKGVGSQLLKKCSLDNELIFAAGTGPISYPLFIKAGFNEVQPFHCLSRYSFSLKLFKAKNIPRNLYNSKYILNSLMSKFYEAKLAEEQTDLHFELMSNVADQDVENMNRMLASMGKNIFIERNSYYLNWRLFQSAALKKFHSFKIFAGRKIVGYAVLATNEFQSKGVIVELLIDRSEDTRFFHPVVQYICSYFKTLGCYHVDTVTGNDLMHEFTKLGFCIKPMKIKYLFYINQNGDRSLESSLINGDDWLLNQSVSDLPFFV